MPLVTLGFAMRTVALPKSTGREKSRFMHQGFLLRVLTLQTETLEYEGKPVFDRS